MSTAPERPASRPSRSKPGMLVRTKPSHSSTQEWDWKMTQRPLVLLSSCGFPHWCGWLWRQKRWNCDHMDSKCAWRWKRCHIKLYKFFSLLFPLSLWSLGISTASRSATSWRSSPTMLTSGGTRPFLTQRRGVTSTGTLTSSPLRKTSRSESFRLRLSHLMSRATDPTASPRSSTIQEMVRI